MEIVTLTEKEWHEKYANFVAAQLEQDGVELLAFGGGDLYEDFVFCPGKTMHLSHETLLLMPRFTFYYSKKVRHLCPTLYSYSCLDSLIETAKEYGWTKEVTSQWDI